MKSLLTAVAGQPRDRSGDLRQPSLRPSGREAQPQSPQASHATRRDRELLGLVAPRVGQEGALAGVGRSPCI
jgi:hypothetical protein